MFFGATACGFVSFCRSHSFHPRLGVACLVYYFFLPLSIPFFYFFNFFLKVTTITTHCGILASLYTRSCPCNFLSRFFFPFAENDIKKAALTSCFFYKQKDRICKPGSVEGNHLSAKRVTTFLPPNGRRHPCGAWLYLQPCVRESPATVLLRIGFTFAALLPASR